MTRNRIRLLTIACMMVLHVPAQVHAAWSLSSPLNVVSRLSRTRCIYGGLATTMIGLGVWYCCNYLCTKNLEKKQQGLDVILRSRPDCAIKPFITGTLREADFQALQGIPFAHRLRSERGNHDNTGFVLYQNQELVGFIVYDHASYDSIRKNTPCYGQAEIMILGIRESHQGCGLGTLLMQYVMQVIRNKGYEHIILTADAQFNKRSQEDLCKFYEKLGFKKIDEGVSAQFIYTRKNDPV